MKKIIIPVLALFISSCASNEIGHSKDVNQDEIHQGYSINYDESRNETEVIAFFRFAGPNGTTLILNEPSKIELNGEVMNNVQSGLGSYYSKSVKGKLPDNEYVFAFSDITGKKFENKMDFRNMQIEELPKEIKKSDGLTIHFPNKPEGRKEDLTVEISDDSTTVSEVWKNVVFERVKFPKEKLDQLHGKVKVNIHRNGLLELRQHAHAGGFFSSEYTLAPREITLIE